jgi:hypothetical protein
MHADNPISGLMFFTLAATVFIIAGAFIYFLRSRTNREIAARALEGNGSRAGAAPSGAGPELIGFAVIANRRDGSAGNGLQRQVETVRLTPPVGGETTGMAQPSGSSNEPKLYQPANPAP